MKTPKDSRSISTLSLESVLDGVGGQRHATAALPLGKGLGTNFLSGGGAGWDPEPVWRDVENLPPPTGI
jgi:hypothetical protein